MGSTLLVWVLVGVGGAPLLAASEEGPHQRGAGEAAQAPPLNRLCPVTTDEEVDPAITLVYKGRTIAFCCDRCRARFKLNPEEYLANLDPPLILGAASGSGDPASPSAEHDEQADHETHEHRHAADDGTDGGEEQAPWLARVHPVIVHFPVAGVPLALLGFLAWGLTGRAAFAGADLPALVVATLASIAAVITGNMAEDSMRFAPSLHDFVEWHERIGITVMIMLIALCLLRLWRWERAGRRRKWLYGGALAVVTALLAVTGYLGGSLVFGPEHLKWW